MYNIKIERLYLKYSLFRGFTVFTADNIKQYMTSTYLVLDILFHSIKCTSTVHNMINVQFKIHIIKHVVIVSNVMLKSLIIAYT